MNSQWRAAVVGLTQLPARVAFLDLQGPQFIPGQWVSDSDSDL